MSECCINCYAKVKTEHYFTAPLQFGNLHKSILDQEFIGKSDHANSTLSLLLSALETFQVRFCMWQ